MQQCACVCACVLNLHASVWLGATGSCVCFCVCVCICTSTCCHDGRKQQRRGSPSTQPDIKNNIPSLHVGSMSPQQGAHTCMINESMYVCWLHIPLCVPLMATLVDVRYLPASHKAFKSLD